MLECRESLVKLPDFKGAAVGALQQAAGSALQTAVRTRLFLLEKTGSGVCLPGVALPGSFG